jgi:hypothetical protein
MFLLIYFIGKMPTKILYRNLIVKVFDYKELASNNAKTLLQNYTCLIECRGILFQFFS